VVNGFCEQKAKRDEELRRGPAGRRIARLKAFMFHPTEESIVTEIRKAGKMGRSVQLVTFEVMHPTRAREIGNFLDIL
jgi:hypothetical protein